MCVVILLYNINIYETCVELGGQKYMDYGHTMNTIKLNKTGNTAHIFEHFVRACLDYAAKKSLKFDYIYSFLNSTLRHTSPRAVELLQEHEQCCPYVTII